MRKLREAFAMIGKFIKRWLYFHIGFTIDVSIFNIHIGFNLLPNDWGLCFNIFESAINIEFVCFDLYISTIE